MNNQNIIFYGAKWCGDCRRAQQFLDSHNIHYQYIDLEKDPQAIEKVLEINNGMQSIPTIIFPSGKILVEPSNLELKSELHL